MGFAVGGEGVEEFAGDFGGDAWPGVLDFGGDFAIFHAEAQQYFAAAGHGVGGVVDEIVEHAAQAFGIEQEFDWRRGILQVDAGGF